MDNERFTLDKRSRHIAIIGGGCLINGTSIHLALEASILVVDDDLDVIRGLEFDAVYINEVVTMARRLGRTRTIECMYSPQASMNWIDRPRRRARGGGQYDRKGRRRI